MADELDRLFACLVEVLARDTRLAVPFPAAEVYERLVPYRSNRSRLNVATHQDYEMTVLRLLAGERGYVRLEPDDVRESMQREVSSVNPDTSLFRNFPDARVMINRLAAERHLRGDLAYAPPTAEPPPDEPPVGAGGGAAAARSAIGDEEAEEEEGEEPSASHFSLEPGPESPLAQCAYCGGSLPANRKVNFCPHCGQPPSGELKCPACGSEVDVGWAYCVSCGRATGFE